MAAESDRSWESEAERNVRPWWSQIFRWFGRQAQSLARYGFSSLSRRILFLNLLALFGLMTGILFLNQFREGLIDAREESLLTQGEIIAAAIAASATVETNTITIDPDRLLELETGQSLSPVDEFDSLEFPINPAKIAPVLRHLILPTGTRARIYDDTGSLILDSRNLYSRGEILRYDLPKISMDEVSWYDRIRTSFMVWLRRGDLPLYEELGPDEGLGYPEVTAALTGSKGVMV
ncbi:MAG: stimulus-sensing domain-containing protein, partial [Rhizobiales bacterium]|nr:stimulus-sensing domain-containing protein [Hyphomicrobiales bacterium]